MARRKSEVAARRHGLRDRLVAATETALVRLQDADSVVYDFSAERARLRARLAALRAGEDVLFHRWGDGAVGGFWPDRTARLCRLVGDELRPVVPDAPH
ncbi:hypothetical protein [Mycolicibacterium goodii]|uniref:Uncharacterized protein n=1 Tax=Mycolicibacterium goodii TaxID=134601 RepID=A0ABS6HSV1_MYCGD|nr:hypothetical protein [Mycolicibacterium goodii]MBU8824392.1 hypothetical protein [Mycolicibacterium goodii]MBU8837532.1 hypothetical protein [Mycolicibacterium goodii]